MNVEEMSIQIRTEKYPLNGTVRSYLVQFQESHGRNDWLGSKGVETGSADYSSKIYGGEETVIKY